MLHGIDISNHQGFPSVYESADWYRNAEFVIVQAIVPPAGSPGAHTDIATQQMRHAKASGKKLGIYVWLWNAYSGMTLHADLFRRMSTVPQDVELDMRVWLDVEDTTAPFNRETLLDTLAFLDEWSAVKGLPPTGIYTGRWYIDGYMGGWWPEGRMLWLADYSVDPMLFPARPVHQYTSLPVDLDVMLDNEIVNREVAVQIPQEYQDKFGIAADDVIGLIANLEGVAETRYEQGYQEGAEQRDLAILDALADLKSRVRRELDA